MVRSGAREVTDQVEEVLKRLWKVGQVEAVLIQSQGKEVIGQVEAVLYLKLNRWSLTQQPMGIAALDLSTM
jgi:DNA-binding TFAR19-related protein (PDSD5 family)